MRYFINIFLVTICLALAACEKGDIRVTEVSDHYCYQNSADSRASFILQCINNANPRSDEEPEDWIRQCQIMAEETLCPVRTVIVTERCLTDMGCVWREIGRKLKEIEE